MGDLWPAQGGANGSSAWGIAFPRRGSGATPRPPEAGCCLARKEKSRTVRGLGSGAKLVESWGGRVGPGGAGPVGSVGGLVLGGAAQNEVGRLLGLAGGHDHGAAVVLEDPEPAPDVGGGVLQGGALDVGVGAEEPGAHLGHQLLPAVVGGAEERPVLQGFPGQTARGAGAVDQLMR